VDAESERLIQCALERFSEGRTTLVIAHRLSTLEKADRLLVMDMGRLAEQGTHDRLLEANGLYARLVRLQFGSARRGPANGSDLSEANEEADCQGVQNSSPDAVSEPGTPRFEVKWLIPATTRIWEGSHGVLMAEADGLQAAGVFTVRAFPATHSEEYLSLRFFDDHGRETEIGMIRALSEWPPEVQELLRRSLNRRYLLRIMQTIFAHQQAGGLVLCSGTTDEGPVEFSVRNDPHHAARFGNQGWLLTDLEGNHYLVADLNELPFLQRRLFRLVFQEI